MDFLDNAVAKTKEVLDIAYKVTDEAITKGKQKIDEITLERIIEKEYQKLGKIYYEMVKEVQGLPEEVAEIIQSLKEKLG